jgi:hypothetical protein
MLGKTALVGCLVLGACTKSEGGDSLGSAMATSAAKSGSGGFSADLAKEMGVAKGSGSSAAAAKPDEPAEPAAGRGSAKPDDTIAMAGSGSAKAVDKPAMAGSGSGKPADTVAMTGSAAPPAKPAAPPPPDKAAPDKAAPAAPPPPAKPPAPAAPDKAAPAAPEIKPPAIKPPQTPVVEPAHGSSPAQVPANLAAIKLSLLPNWDRDLGEAGTFQYVVRIKGSQNTKTFVFHYGYDDPRAPSDREQYKKFLLDNALMSGELKDRQRGGAWFLEGTDASGSPAFRYVVLFGGKRLICYGSLYKDAESNKLGDDRDQTIIQAKQICETLAL